ncbi:MAG: I78 family peptidase inhibitor [Pseudoxanthomonas suwonensis]|nr:I78 family peptidase inhibitor [Pseudoxanthomonas suwonensis]
MLQCSSRHFHRGSLVMLCTVALAACVGTSTSGSGTGAGAVQGVARCSVDNLQSRFVGRTASDEVVAEAVEATGSSRVRVLAPDDMATMDYVGSRLNVLTDDTGVIRELRCG